jgi:putative flavoprotein involved in K+ transport
MPLIRVKPADLIAAGVERAPRVTGVVDGKPRLADGRVLDVANVIWCTGFHPGFSWVDLPIRGLAESEPEQVRGVVPAEPGLYFVGLTFLYSASSTMIHGVARDAERVADAIVARVAAARSDAAPAPRVAAVG